MLIQSSTCECVLSLNYWFKFIYFIRSFKFDSKFLNFNHSSSEAKVANNSDIEQVSQSIDFTDMTDLVVRIRSTKMLTSCFFPPIMSTEEFIKRADLIMCMWMQGNICWSYHCYSIRNLIDYMMLTSVNLYVNQI